MTQSSMRRCCSSAEAGWSPTEADGGGAKIVPEGKVIGSMEMYEHKRATHPVEDKPPTSNEANVCT